MNYILQRDPSTRGITDGSRSRAITTQSCMLNQGKILTNRYVMYYQLEIHNSSNNFFFFYYMCLRYITVWFDPNWFSSPDYRFRFGILLNRNWPREERPVYDLHERTVLIKLVRAIEPWTTAQNFFKLNF